MSEENRALATSTAAIGAPGSASTSSAANASSNGAVASTAATTQAGNVISSSAAVDLTTGAGAEEGVSLEAMLGGESDRYLLTEEEQKKR